MVVEVRLFATLRQGRFKDRQTEFSQGSSLGDLLQELGISAKEVGILLVNGQDASVERSLSANDVVSIFPLIGGG
jgi:sulfur carrier protein ThiS